MTRTHVTELENEVYVVHYAGTASDGPAPRIQLSITPEGNGLLMKGGRSGGQIVLAEIGEAAVAWNRSSVQLTIAVIPALPGASTNATVTVQKLSDLIRKVPNPDASRLLPAAGRDFGRENAQLQLTAHIAGQGDVTAAPGQWCPTAANIAPIEGLAIAALSLPTGIAIDYRVRVSGPQGQQSSWAKAGRFVGSRGRSLPVTSLECRISGPSADQFVINAEGRFAGQIEKSGKGRAVLLQGPTGYEPLTALKLAIGSATQSTVSSDARPKAQSPSLPRQGGVRIFRRQP